MSSTPPDMNRDASAAQSRAMASLSRPERWAEFLERNANREVGLPNYFALLIGTLATLLFNAIVLLDFESERTESIFTDPQTVLVEHFTVNQMSLSMYVAIITLVVSILAILEGFYSLSANADDVPDGVFAYPAIKRVVTTFSLRDPDSPLTSVRNRHSLSHVTGYIREHFLLRDADHVHRLLEDVSEPKQPWSLSVPTHVASAFLVFAAVQGILTGLVGEEPNYFEVIILVMCLALSALLPMVLERFGSAMSNVSNYLSRLSAQARDVALTLAMSSDSGVHSDWNTRIDAYLRVDASDDSIAHRERFMAPTWVERIVAAASRHATWMTWGSAALALVTAGVAAWQGVEQLATGQVFLVALVELLGGALVSYVLCFPLFKAAARTGAMRVRNQTASHHMTVLYVYVGLWLAGCFVLPLSVWWTLVGAFGLPIGSAVLHLVVWLSAGTAVGMAVSGRLRSMIEAELAWTIAHFAENIGKVLHFAKEGAAE